MSIRDTFAEASYSLSLDITLDRILKSQYCLCLKVGKDEQMTLNYMGKPQEAGRDLAFSVTDDAP